MTYGKTEVWGWGGGATELMTEQGHNDSDT